MQRLLLISIVFFFGSFGISQEKNIFASYDFSSDLNYQNKLEQLEANPFKTEEELEELIQLATQYKDYVTVIKYLEALIEKRPGSAELYHKLSEANGIRIFEISRFMALFYVSEMKANLLKAHELDSTHLPTLHILYQFYEKLPKFLGGDMVEAKRYADIVLELSLMEGMLARGFIFEAENNIIEAKKSYSIAFEQLNFLKKCNSEEVEDFFKNKIRNLSYRIGSLGVEFSLDPSISICALEYYLRTFSVYDNLRKELVYFNLAVIHQEIGNNEEASMYRSLALEVNPNYKPAKRLKIYK